MISIVITGSTRGIGYALARSFLEKGCRVVISGRKQEGVDDSIRSLAKDYGSGKVCGAACDVSRYSQIAQLWEYAVDAYGVIDIWINNAGISNALNPVTDIPQEEMRSVLETNMLGEMYGSQVAIKGFNQQGHGALYNMEGMGSKKTRMVDGLSIYGATKAGLRYFNDAIAHENRHANIIIGALLPGMVLTEMVTGQYEGDQEGWNKVLPIFNAISADVNEVANWLAEKMLNNKKNGVRFTYSNPIRIFSRMLGVMVGKVFRR